MSHFDPRDLRAFSVEPLLLYPTHYTGEPGYFSDTETSSIWDDEAISTDWDRQYAKKTAQQEQIHSIAQNSVTGDTPPPASRASRDELWVLDLFSNYTTEWQNTLTHSQLTPQCPPVPSSLATLWPIALQLAGMLEHHLAFWLILHKDTQAPFIFTYLFHHAFQGPNCPRWTLQSVWRMNTLWKDRTEEHRHMGVRFGFASWWTRQTNLYFNVFFYNFFSLL